MPTGITFEFIQRNHLRKLGKLLIEQIEIAHGSYAGDIEPVADFLCRNSLFESEDDVSDESAGDSVIAREKGVLFKEALATVTAITSFAQMQEGISGKGDIRAFCGVILLRYGAGRKYFRHQ